ncbi:MAG: Holliday junction branch migration protein RuvA [Bacillota bacterium]|nr:Holliday junction branch migration protein RuvA [Bacillota bacterium]
MIDSLTGRLVAAAVGKAVLEIGGIGFSLDMPPAGDDLHSFIGKEITIYTRLLVKDDELLLYGFRAVEERKLFNLILGVSGFGPRLALSLLGIFNVSQLYVAVLEENIAQLCRAPGIGRKAAQRLILEIKEKLPKVLSAEELAVDHELAAGLSIYDEITEALCALGYSRGEAAAAVSRAVDQNKEASREELLKRALKSMGQK